MHRNTITKLHKEVFTVENIKLTGNRANTYKITVRRSKNSFSGYAADVYFEDGVTLMKFREIWDNILEDTGLKFNTKENGEWTVVPGFVKIRIREIDNERYIGIVSVPVFVD
ncbi:hypothetical protein [Moorena sp. SIO3A2]|uniref:hypothetical protein n=1 Tax=Moorena sp. SIO3A2 TaxID=2607841 RepID=UPI00257B8AAC|nr:hypothetical protein [Moorena sp. SIO3A2]